MPASQTTADHKSNELHPNSNGIRNIHHCNNSHQTPPSSSYPTQQDQNPPLNPSQSSLSSPRFPQPSVTAPPIPVVSNSLVSQFPPFVSSPPLFVPFCVLSLVSFFRRPDA